MSFTRSKRELETRYCTINLSMTLLLPDEMRTKYNPVLTAGT